MEDAVHWHPANRDELEAAASARPPWLTDVSVPLCSVADYSVSAGSAADTSQGSEASLSLQDDDSGGGGSHAMLRAGTGLDVCRQSWEALDFSTPLCDNFSEAWEELQPADLVRRRLSFE